MSLKHIEKPYTRLKLFEHAENAHNKVTGLVEDDKNLLNCSRNSLQKWTQMFVYCEWSGHEEILTMEHEWQH